MFYSKDQIHDLVIKGEIEITPFDPNLLKEASYTFTLDSKIRTLKNKEFLDSRIDPEFDEIEIPEQGYKLNPGELVLCNTKETINLKGKYICLVGTRSTIAQMGIDVAQSSFIVEPDTNNQLILEVTNNGSLPVVLYPGTKIIKGIFSSVNM